MYFHFILIQCPTCIVYIITGHLLDSLARTALWDSGLDYLHGTGHGVGAFLNVHEGMKNKLLTYQL